MLVAAGAELDPARNTSTLPSELHSSRGGVPIDIAIVPPAAVVGTAWQSGALAGRGGALRGCGTA